MRNAGSADTDIQLLVTSKASSDDRYPIREIAFLSDQHINFTGNLFKPALQYGIIEIVLIITFIVLHVYLILAEQQ